MNLSLETERLSIRDISDDDLDFIFEGLSQPDVIRYYGVHFSTKEETKTQMTWYAEIENNNTGKWWIINAKNSGDSVGAIGFNYYQLQHHRIEVGFWLLPKFQGSGIMFEALTAVIPIALQKWKIHRIEALVETENIASKKLLIASGFICEGLLRDYERKGDRYVSLEVFSKIC